MTVEGIGTIRNTVVDGIDLPPVLPARTRSRARSPLTCTTRDPIRRITERH